MRAVNACRSSGFKVRGMADKNNKPCGADTLVRETCPRNSGRADLLADGYFNSISTICPTVVPSLASECVTLASTDSRATAFPQLYNLVEHPLRNFPLRGLGNLDYFALGDDGDRVAVGIEANTLARNVIDYDCG